VRKGGHRETLYQEKEPRQTKNKQQREKFLQDVGVYRSASNHQASTFGFVNQKTHYLVVISSQIFLFTFSLTLLTYSYLPPQPPNPKSKSLQVFDHPTISAVNRCKSVSPLFSLFPVKPRTNFNNVNRVQLSIGK